jgi:single-strand DNA-binding protein
MYNKVILIGNLTRDVELRYTQSGSAIAKFGLAVNRTWKDKNSGERRDDVCFVDISIFGRSAEIANQYLSKGKRILVEGRLVFEQWTDQNGQKRSKHSVAAESFQFLESKAESGFGGETRDEYSQSNQNIPSKQPQQNEQQVEQNNTFATQNIDISDDEIPF